MLTRLLYITGIKYKNILLTARFDMVVKIDWQIATLSLEPIKKAI